MKIRAVKNDRGVYLHSEDIADLVFRCITTPCANNERELVAQKIWEQLQKVSENQKVPLIQVEQTFKVIPAIEII